MKKRILAALLAAVLVIGLFPVTALAAEGDTTTELPKLDAPSELKWHTAAKFTFDGGNIKDILVGGIDAWGYACWKTNAPVACTCTVELYYKGKADTNFENIATVTISVDPIDGYLLQYGSVYALENEWFRGNGTYKFTVQVHAPGYQDSDIVESTEWTYINPEKGLNTPSNLGTNVDGGIGLVWEWEPGDDSLKPRSWSFNGYYSETEANATTTANLTDLGIMFQLKDIEDEFAEDGIYYSSDCLANVNYQKGEGYYYFKVRADSPNYDQINDSDWSELSPAYHHVDSRTKLPAPTDLQWDRFWSRDDEGNVQTVNVPLCMSWTFEEGALDNLPHEIEIQAGVFQVNDDPEGEDELIELWNAYYTSEYGYDRLYYYGLYKGDELDLQSGKYYFAVRMITDRHDPDFKDGDLVRSPILEYTRPDAKLTAPGKLVGAIDDAGDFSWKGTWDETEHRDKGYHFEFEYYYSADNGEATSVEELTELPGHSYGDTDEDDALYTNLWVQHMEEETLKPGYYYCRVQATSKDIKTVLNSDWSELSAGTYLYPLVENMIEVDLSDETYTGKPITKKITIKAGDKTLVEGTDYTVEYANNTNVSTGDTKAEIQIIGKGIYSGGNAFYYTFTIKAKSTGGGGGGSPSGGGSTGGGSSKPVEPENPPVEPENPPVEPETPVTHASEKFSDVAKDSWYEAGVTYVTDKGLFQGLSEGVFAPDTNMTRAMLMTVLARLDGQETSGGATWYAKAMDWAKAQGISDGSAPDGSVTREQLVTMLYRYAKPEKVEGGLDGFGDKDEVSAWAKEAMEWAVANGIVTGKGGARLDPQGTATRAEVATIIQRFAEKTEQ